MKSYSNRGLQALYCKWFNATVFWENLVKRMGKKNALSGRDRECEQMNKCQLLTPFATQSMFLNGVS